MVVFVSYANEDYRVAMTIVDEMRKQTSSDIFGGAKHLALFTVSDRWDVAIKAIAQANSFVCILSKNWINSLICQAELAYAFKANKGITLIAIDDDILDYDPVSVFKESPEHDLLNLLGIQDLAETVKGNKRIIERFDWIIIRSDDSLPEIISLAFNRSGSDFSLRNVYQGRAIKWKIQGESEELLLAGSEIHDAYMWMSETQNEVSSDSNKLLYKYIEASRRFEDSKKLSQLSRAPRPSIFSRVRNAIKDIFADKSDSSSSKLTDKEAKPIAFVTYNPKQALKQKRYSLVVYAFHPEEEQHLIEADVQKFTPEFGYSPKSRQSKDQIKIARKTVVEVVPESEHIEFEPRRLKKTWDGDWVRYNFEFKVPENFEEDELWLRISIRIKGLEVAHIRSSCEIIDEETSAKTSLKMPGNPLARAMELGDLYQAIAKPYRNVFISYSRKDQDFALQRAAEIERILGDNVFLDVKSMRAGQHWQQELANAIRDADIFHLLWSEHSAESEYCRYEWDYALNHKCPDNMCVGVIRPVYWSKPMPAPPDELSHLHFEYIELDETAE